MKLIDADAFLKEYCEPYPHIYQAMSSAFKHAPTVDAIPISWLEQHIKDAETLFWLEYASALKSLLYTWNEVNEE